MPRDTNISYYGSIEDNKRLKLTDAFEEFLPERSRFELLAMDC